MMSKSESAQVADDIQAELPEIHDIRIMRMPSVVDATGISRAGIYRLLVAGQFPEPVQLTERSIGWYAIDIRRWLAQLPTAHPGQRK